MCENQIRTARRCEIEMEPRKIRVIGNGGKNGVFDDFREAKNTKKVESGISQWPRSLSRVEVSVVCLVIEKKTRKKKVRHLNELLRHLLGTIIDKIFCFTQRVKANEKKTRCTQI